MAMPAPNALTSILPVQLTTTQFQDLAAIPPELEWFANLTNPNTRRVYEQDIKDFQAFTGLRQPEEFRHVTRAHVIAWRQQLVKQELANERSDASSPLYHRSMLTCVTATRSSITRCWG